MMLDYKIIGKRIKFERLKQMKTQKEISKEMKVTPVFYSRIENGQIHLSLKRLAEISILLDVSIDYLLHGIETENSNLENIDIKFYKLLKKCTPEQKKLILQIAETTVKNK